MSGITGQMDETLKGTVHGWEIRVADPRYGAEYVRKL